ncbi:MAG TPA: VWA domain-containing protein, partial [Thermoanaerobaculia bacterium]
MRAPQAAAVLLSFLSLGLFAQESTFNVTASVRDGDGNAPRDLKPSDVQVFEGGVEIPVVAVKPATDRSILIYVDLDLTSKDTLVAATRALAADAARLTTIGPVSVAVAKPEGEWVARGLTDPQALAKALTTLEALDAKDSITAWRKEVPWGLVREKAAQAIAVEADIAAAFRQRFTRFLAGAPRREVSAVILVSDCSDLDGLTYYAPIMRHLDEAKELRDVVMPKEQRAHEEFASKVAAGGWTVIALSEHPHGSIVALADDTGGRAGHVSELPATLASLNDRVRLTVKVPRALDAVVRPIKLSPRRAGLTVQASRWASAYTTEDEAATRALELLKSGGKGELPMVARVQLGEGEDRSRRATGGLEVRLGIDALGAQRAQLDRTKLRVSIAVASEKTPENVIHHLIDNYDLTNLQRVLFTSQLQIDPVVRRMTIVIEELSTRKWGTASIEIPPWPGERLFASAGYDAEKALIIAEDAPPESDGLTWMTWQEGLARARAEKKLVFVRIDSPLVCFNCESPNPRIYRHDAFRRMMETTYVPVRIDRDLAKTIGAKEYVSVADSWGRVRFSWEPKTAIDLASRLSIVKPFIAPLIAAGDLMQANPDSADAYFLVGWSYLQIADLIPARAAYTKARLLAQKQSNGPLLERIDTHLAVIDARTGHRDKARPALESIVANAKSDLNATEALLVLGHVYRADGDAVKSADAFSRAAARAPKGSDLESTALALTGADLAPVVAGADGTTTILKPAQLIRPRGTIVAGRVELQTLIRDARVNEVRFFVDGKALTTDQTPPFTARAALDAAPRPHVFRIEAYASDGRLLGDDTLRVNERHDELAIRIVSPREGNVDGKTRVELDVKRPAQARLARVELYWNEARLATLRQAPFVADVTLPKESGYVRAVAVLADGRSAEDAVSLNVGGYAVEIDVALTEIYARVTDAKGQPITNLTKNDFTVMDQGERREVTRAQYLDRPPLLIGLAVDTSGSMANVIFDMQTAAQSFLRNAFESDARAFLIGFDQAPRLVHETTNDLTALTSQIEEMRVQGSTTVLYDAIMFALLQFEGTEGKKVLVVVS